MYESVAELPEFVGTAWRAESGYSHAPGTTVADIIRFEREELGNEYPDISDKLLQNLDHYSASDAGWVNRRRKDCLTYLSEGESEEAVGRVHLPKGSKIISPDYCGGYLVLRGLAEPMLKKGGNPIEAVPKGVEARELDAKIVDLFIERHGREAYSRGEAGETLERISQRAEEYDPEFLEKHPEIKGKQIVVYHDPIVGEDLAVIDFETGGIVEILSPELKLNPKPPAVGEVKGGNPMPEFTPEVQAVIDRWKGQIVKGEPLVESEARREVIRAGKYKLGVGKTDEAIRAIKLGGGNPMPRTEAERKSFHERIFGKGSPPPLERLGRGQTVNNLLPMPPESGPPLPRALGLRWPWKK